MKSLAQMHSRKEDSTEQEREPALVLAVFESLQLKYRYLCGMRKVAKY